MKVYEVTDHKTGDITFHYDTGEIVAEYKRLLQQDGELTEHADLALTDLYEGIIHNGDLKEALGITVEFVDKPE